MLKKYLIVFLVSMVPLIELRGAIPYGTFFGLPLWQTYVIAGAADLSLCPHRAGVGRRQAGDRQVFPLVS